MKTIVEPQEGNKVKLAVEIDEAEFDTALAAAFKKIAQEVRIPGFRPGKVPRRILEQRVGTEYARQQALQDGLPDFYVRALVENDIDAISAPELNLTGGQESGPVAFDAVVEVRPTVRVPGYDGLQVTIPSPKATEAEIDDQVDRMRAAFATINEVDRQAQPGDHIRIDVAGTIDDEAVPGLTAEDYLYELGSKAVVPELDDQLLAVSAGDVLDFSAPVPGDEDSVIEFHIEVKAVNERILPDVNDEWAASSSEFTTLAELRTDISNRMSMMKRVQSYLALRDATLKELVDLVDADDLPEVLINGEVQRRLEDMAQRLAPQGASIEQYLETTGLTTEQFVAQLKEEGAGNVKADLALRAVAHAEDLGASDEEVDAEIKRLAERFKMKPATVRRNIERNFQMSTLRADVRKSKALNWLMERVQLVDEEGGAIDRKDIELNPAELQQANEAIDTAELDLDSGDDDHSGHDHDHSDDDHAGHNH